jgi:ABC-type dipeptide/oligopeptide/nickel transport system permease component
MLFFISLVAFLLVKLAPGDPVAAYITPRMARKISNVFARAWGWISPWSRSTSCG